MLVFDLDVHKSYKNEFIVAWTDNMIELCIS
jgi:hypothetical protein